MRPFTKGFMAGFCLFGRTIANIVNFLLLLVAYAVGIGITSVVAKIVGKHFLDYRTKDSYWVERKLGREKKERYYRLY